MYVNIVTFGMRTCNSPFLMNEALLSISPAGGGQSVEMLIALEPHGKIWITFSILIYLYIVQPL